MHFKFSKNVQEEAETHFLLKVLSFYDLGSEGLGLKRGSCFRDICFPFWSKTHFFLLSVIPEIWVLPADFDFH